VTFLRDNLGKTYDPSWFLKTVETIFNMIFLAELISRLIADNKRFLFSGWNIFDFVIVALSLFDESKKYKIGNVTGVNASATKTIRVFRLLRTLKIIRVVRAFRELRIVLLSVFSCLRQLFWTMLLLFLILYITAVLLLSILAQEGDQAFNGGDMADIRLRLFGDLPRTLVTMFQCTTNGLDWEEASRSLEEVIDGPIPPLLVMILFNAITVFALMNTVTGLFVDQAISASAQDTRNVMLEEREAREAAMVFMKQKITTASKGKKYINLKNLTEVAADKTAIEIFKKFGIDFRDVMTFYDCVADSDRTIKASQLDQFLKGIFRLSGQASATEMVALAYNLSRLK
jgi:voltage-gated sodium channel